MVISTVSALAVILAYAVFHQGGVYSEHWNLCLLGLGLLALLYVACTWRARRSAKLEPWLCWCTVLLPAYAAFQLIPLPESVLKILSPQRAHLLLALAQVDPAITSAPLTIVPAETLTQVLRIVACVVTFLLVRDMAWRSPNRRWILSIPIIGIALLEAGLGLAQYDLQTQPGIASGTYKNRNHFAGLLEMALPFAVMYAVVIINRIRQRRNGAALLGWALLLGLLLVSAVVIFLGIARSSSRMGFVACLASLSILAAFGISSARPGSTRLFVLGSPAVLFLAAFIALTPESLISRYGDLTSTPEGRIAIWRDSSHLLAAYPVFGCGMGGFESALWRYKTSLPLSTVNFAHNDYLQLASELGIVGFAIVAVLVVLLFKSTLTASLKSRERDDRFLAWACVASMVAILLHSLVDFNMYVPANSMLFAWVVGMSNNLGSST